MQGDNEYGSAGGDLQQCGNCGRRFNAAALQRHAKVCEKVFCQKRKVFNMQSQRLQGLEAAKFAPKDEVNQAWGKPEYGSSSSGSSKPGTAGRKPGSSSNSSSSGQRQRQAPARAGPGSLSSNGRQQQQQPQQFDSRPAMSAAEAKKSKWQQQSEQLRNAMRAGQGGSSSSSGYNAGSYPAAQPVEDNRIPCPHCGRRFAELAAERHIPKCSEIRAKPTGLRAGGELGRSSSAIRAKHDE
ncbi:hypothetical protein OEZ86_010401 [Tetradesmus obliquus]|nr:hypothetical protein OEZ86_010401 [Tetradesmus obliquus]